MMKSHKITFASTVLHTTPTSDVSSYPVKIRLSANVLKNWFITLFKRLCKTYTADNVEATVLKLNKTYSVRAVGLCKKIYQYALAKYYVASVAAARKRKTEIAHI